ncbi:glycosyltransferase [Frateuria aurantia]
MPAPPSRWTVVQLIPAMQAGGAERSVLEIGRALVAEGHRSIVVSAGGRLVQTLHDEGSEHLSLEIGRKSLRTLGALLPLHRHLRELRPDIVHVRSRLPAWLAAVAMRGLAARPAVVSTVHGLNSPGRYSSIMLRADAVIAVSETVREYIGRHYPDWPAERMRVIPRAVDPAAFPRGFQPSAAWLAAWAARHPKLGGGRLLVLPGRGTRLKGHRHALTLLSTLRGQGEDVRLWLPGVVEPGREAYLEELQALARHLDVAGYVEFSPSQTDVREIYARADLVLQLSDKPEALGRTVLEALSLGTPVAGFAHGGVGELLARHYPEGAVPLGDAFRLAETVRGLLQRPQPPAPLQAGTLDQMQSATLQVYRDVTAQRMTAT